MAGKLDTNPLPPHLSDSNTQIIDTNVPSLRLYQVWKGRNSFCFGGRLIFGPDMRSMFLTVCLIVIPVALFCAFVSQRLINGFPNHQGNLIVAICVVFTVYVIILLFLTSGRDPGIIPRNLHPPDPEDGDGSSLSSDWLGSQNGAAPSLPQTKDVIVNRMVVKVKYCQTCMLYRPPRCSHCSICNNCVDRFDHHCPWVGQCIGKRNYRFFFMFVSSTTMLCLYVFAFCCVNIRKIMNEYHCNFWRAFLESPASGILILYTFTAAWFVGGLTSFHLYLIFTNQVLGFSIFISIDLPIVFIVCVQFFSFNYFMLSVQTTYENFRYHYDRKMNPYNRGCAHNTGEIFFSKIPSSKNKFRAKVEGDPSFMYTKSMSSGHAMSPEMPNMIFDIEMGKRLGVAAEDLEDVTSQIGSVGGLERCRTQPKHTNCDQKADWEISPDIHMLVANFEMVHGSTDRQNSSRPLKLACKA